VLDGVTSFTDPKWTQTSLIGFGLLSRNNRQCLEGYGDALGRQPTSDEVRNDSRYVTGRSSCAGIARTDSVEVVRASVWAISDTGAGLSDSDHVCA
jgi:hypothetical protein